MNSVIDIAGLRVVRGGRTVLEGLDLTIDPGVTGLLGPSGCGKSTLLRSIVGVQRVAAGTVTVLGEAAGSAPLRHRIGYQTQAASVYEDLTVAENLRFFARVLGAAPGSVDRAIDTLVTMAERAVLAHLEKLEIDQLVMRTLVDDRPCIQHQDLVRVPDGRQPVRDHQRRAALHQKLQPFLDELLRLGVERRCRFVENQNRCIFEKCTRDGKTLAFAGLDVHDLDGSPFNPAGAFRPSHGAADRAGNRRGANAERSEGERSNGRFDRSAGDDVAVAAAAVVDRDGL